MVARSVVRSTFALSLLFVACGPLGEVGPAPAPAELPPVAYQQSRPDLRIAVVGAGPSGLTAAHTLRARGYRNVTVFEKEGDVGGKVHTLRVGDIGAELGAVFASADYKVVLGLADEHEVPYVPYQGPRYILDEKKVKRTFHDFLTSRYTPAEIQRAVVNYAAVLARFPEIERDGFAGLPADFSLPFTAFAEKHGFTPVAELARSIVTGFGYDFYENVPAAYVMKLLPWLVKIGPNGLESPPYFVFPGGFQSLWRAVAAPMDVKLSSPVARIERAPRGKDGSSGPVRLTVAGGGKQEFDVVILSTPLDVVPKLMNVTAEERKLFGQIINSRYFVTLFFSVNLTQAETVFIHDHGRPANINHVSVWGNPGGNRPVYIAYQLADPQQNAATLFGTLISDVFHLGGGIFTVPLYQKEWTYFPRVAPKTFAGGYFDQVEALQGERGVYYVGGSLSFETVEHSARYARTLVERHFAPVP